MKTIHTSSAVAHEYISFLPCSIAALHPRKFCRKLTNFHSSESLFLNFTWSLSFDILNFFWVVIPNTCRQGFAPTYHTANYSVLHCLFASLSNTRCSNCPSLAGFLSPYLPIIRKYHSYRCFVRLCFTNSSYNTS